MAVNTRDPRYRRITLSCGECDTKVVRKRCRVSPREFPYCSPACKAKGMLNRNGGHLNGRWRGGICQSDYGYVLEYVRRDHPFASMLTKGYIPQHRLVMATHLGRPLTRDEAVHHINGIKNDNRIENLQLLSHSEHARVHNIVAPPCWCGGKHLSRGMCSKHYQRWLKSDANKNGIGGVWTYSDPERPSSVCA